MIAVIYARKSTEQNVTDDAKSVTRQIELARAFAAEKGWQVFEEYADDGISGAVSTKLVNRARMLAAAAEDKFEVLIVRDLDRLSRNDEELPGLIYTLRDAGVEVWSYADRSRVDTRTAISRGMLTMKATFAAAEREAAQARTREAMRRKAERGEVAGGRVLGYSNVRQHGGPVLRVVNEAEATIVRRIFEMAAAGKGLLKIAKALNAEGVKNPTGQDRAGPTKRSDQWSSTGIREVLHRDLYRGRVIYGKTRWEYRRGRKFKVALPESEWVVLDRSDLRIVSDDLWNAAHDRMARTHAAYLRRHNGKLGGRPASGLESKHLLSGFLRCGVCGGNLVYSKKWGKRGRATSVYACATRRTRGEAACSNSHGVPAETLTEAVVGQLRHVLEWGVVADRLSSLIAAPARNAQERADLTERIARLDAELRRGADLVLQGDVPASVLQAIRERETKRRDLAARVEHLDGLSLGDLPDFTTKTGREAWATSIQPLLTDLRDTLEGDPSKARQRLQEVLAGPIVVTPVDGGWTFRGHSSFEAVRIDLETGQREPVKVARTLAGSVGHAMWCPRGDSNTRHAV